MANISNNKISVTASADGGSVQFTIGTANNGSNQAIAQYLRDVFNNHTNHVTIQWRDENDATLSQGTYQTTAGTTATVAASSNVLRFSGSGIDGDSDATFTNVAGFRINSVGTPDRTHAIPDTVQLVQQPGANDFGLRFNDSETAIAVRDFVNNELPELERRHIYQIIFNNALHPPGDNSRNFASGPWTTGLSVVSGGDSDTLVATEDGTINQASYLFPSNSGPFRVVPWTEMRVLTGDGQDLLEIDEATLFQIRYGGAGKSSRSRRLSVAADASARPTREPWQTDGAQDPLKSV